MGPLGMPEIIMILVMLLMLVVPVGVILALIWYFTKGKKPPQLPPMPASPQQRLLEIDDLRAKGLISEAEHEEHRRKILGGV